MYMSDNPSVHVEVPKLNDMTLTALRKSLFRVAERVLATGAPVRIRRGAQILTLSADPQRRSPSRLAGLRQRNLVSGDAKDLWKVKPGKWRGRASPR